MSNFAAPGRTTAPGKVVETVETIAQVRDLLDSLKDRKVGFVPTMGALHKGHLSLVEKARGECGTVVVSIFVNPTQFNDPGDLKNYPRMVDSDLELLRRAGADIVFVPSVQQIYPEPDTRVFDFGSVGDVMEGAMRPGHFNGVGQVVSRLFDIVKPQKAYFGQKDFQQVAVIRRMVQLLGLDVEIVECPTVRETDGLALSSRNMLLTPEHRKAAPAIYKALVAGVEKAGQMEVREVEDFVTREINSDPLLEVEYFKIVNAQTLSPVESWQQEGPWQGCVTVWAGGVRLIDNISFK